MVLARVGTGLVATFLGCVGLKFFEKIIGSPKYQRKSIWYLNITNVPLIRYYVILIDAVS